MEEKQHENVPDPSTVVHAYEICQTRNAKWLRINKLYQKFHRPNFYDIGGTYIDNVADFWFMVKTERVCNNFLLHLFVCNKQGGAFNLSVSDTSEMVVNKKNNNVFLCTFLKDYQFGKVTELGQNYVTTYNFSELYVELMKNKAVYIPMMFHGSDTKSMSQDFINHVKSCHDFDALLKDPIGADFTIESADGRKFMVHKVLLAAQSEVFKAMLKEDTAESQNNYVKLVDVCEDDLQYILEFIYTGTIKNLLSCNCFNLLMLADRYNLKGLRELSQYILSRQLSPDNALETLAVADMYNSDFLKNAAFNFIKKNVSILNNPEFSELNNPMLVRELCKYLAINV